ncbi:alpha-ribazole phosphatase [Tellurirhabdus rosea]|uniref:alpha-ribazole phosphatase n=1 Tax=Tellurirhabdus rosea TaxID=2674997 RepID=UPI00225B1910|nr:alpha-ribazole phosphatase [Tellurirhabdus rosea]
MDLYLIRHTAVSVSRSICYGQADVGLLETYEEEKQRIRALLPEGPVTIWSSPLSRCARLATDLGNPIHFDDRLKEFHFGDWENIPWNDIPAEQLNPWMADFVNIQVPNGESFQAFYERVLAFWEEHIVPEIPDNQSAVALVTHGGVIRCLLCLFLELSLRNAYRLHLDYGSVSRVSIFQNHYTVQYINR